MSEAFFVAAEERSIRATRLFGAEAGGVFLRLSGAVPEGPLRFLLAGGLASLVNWLARFPLSVYMPFGLAVGMAYAIGMGVGFGLYRSWVFPGSALPLPSQAARFVLINVFGLLSVVASAGLLVAGIGATGLVSRPGAEALGHGTAIVVGAVINFLGHRAITFARARHVAEP